MGRIGQPGARRREGDAPPIINRDSQEGATQSYPSKPITIIVPFGPGSATDTISRVIGQQLATALKQGVVVETRPGANGALAALFVARSAPDGYTPLMSTNSPHSAVRS